MSEISGFVCGEKNGKVVESTSLAQNGAVHSVRVDATVDFGSKTPRKGLRRVLTYGTYDLLHYGHVRLLKRASELGDYLVVGLSTDEFNAAKGKRSFYSYDVRREMLESIRYVDLVIPEDSWDQKVEDIRRYCVDVVVMGSDWAGDTRFDSLKKYCEVVYLERTDGISTTELKQGLNL